MIGLICKLIRALPSVFPSPLSWSTWLNAPPAPIINNIPAIGPKQPSVIFNKSSFFKPLQKPRLKYEKNTEIRRAVIGLPINCTKGKYGAPFGAVRSTIVFPTMINIGKSIVNNVTPKDGSFSIGIIFSSNSFEGGPSLIYFETKLEKIGPPIIAAGNPTSSPYIITVPTSAWRAPTIASAAGCGGIMACTVIRPATTGIPILTSDIFVWWATLNITGINKTKPTWKNTGIPQIKATNNIAQCALFWPNTDINVVARRCDPPEISSITPRIVPRPRTVAKNPSVVPIPAWNETAIFWRGIPDAIPRKNAETVNAKNALSFAFIIRNTIRPIEANKTINIHATLPIIKPPIIKLINLYHINVVKFF